MEKGPAAFFIHGSKNVLWRIGRPHFLPWHAEAAN
jgi:hypothetical protein